MSDSKSIRQRSMHKARASLHRIVYASDGQISELEARVSSAEQRELMGLGLTVYGLLVTYVQQASIISAHPSANFWTSNWWFGWLRFFSVDFFSFLEIPASPMLTIQYKMIAAVLPVGALLYLSEHFWSDHAEWRHLYIDGWKATRYQLSATHPLSPAFPKALSAVTTGCAVMVVATPVTVSTAVSVVLGFVVAQLALGEVVVVFIKFARVEYNELRYDDDVDDRPDFFYRVRVECRHLAVTVLNMWYLPLSVGLFSCVELVLRRIRLGSLYDADDEGVSGQMRENIHDGEVANLTSVALGQLDTGWADTILLVLVSVQVMGIAVGFILGFPLYVRRKVQQRKELYRWEPYDIVEGSGESEKGRWVAKREERSPPSKKSLFELGDKVRRMQSLFRQLSWAEQHLDKDQLARWLPGVVHRKMFTPSHHTHRVVAVLDAMEKARAKATAQWDYGLSSYLTRTQEEKGLDSLWMCSRSGWTQWKVFNTFAEKSFMFLFARGIVGNIVAPDRCSPRVTDNESGSESVPQDDICGKFGAVGMLIVSCMVLTAELYARPYINSKEDLVEGLCRLANLCMTIVLNIIEFNLFGGADGSYGPVLVVLLVVPPILAVGYSMYLINPHVIARELLNWLRLFWHKRKLAQIHQAEMVNHFQRQAYDACRHDNPSQLRYLLTLRDIELDLSWTEDAPDRPEEKGFTAVHIAAARGNATCLDELFAHGLFSFALEHHPGVLTPLQLAWKNGCGRCVRMLEELGFLMINPSETQPSLQVDGSHLLRDNIANALVSAGHHPERGSDMEWILNHHDNPGQTKEYVSMTRKRALINVCNNLVMEHQWSGLAALADAIHLRILDLWGEWVSFQVISEIVKAAPRICCLTIDGATLDLQDLETVATSTEFCNTCVVFHGSAQNLATGAPFTKRTAKHATDLAKQSVYSETTWIIAGASRLLESLRPFSNSSASLLRDIHKLGAPGPLDFQPPMRERHPDGTQYRSHPFQTDDSNDPHTWVLVLENWSGKLVVLLQYLGRQSELTQSAPSSSHVTAWLKLTCKANNQLIDPAAQVDISDTRFHKGANIKIATFSIDVDGVLEDIVEIRIFDITVSETIRVGRNCVDWRVTGLNRMIDTETTMFSNTFTVDGMPVPLQMAVCTPHLRHEESTLYNADDLYFHKAGVDLKAGTKLDDDQNEKLRSAILRAFDRFVRDDHLEVMKFSELLSGAARKQCYQLAAENSFEHSAQTNEISGGRYVTIFKSSTGDQGVIEGFIHVCGALPQFEEGCCVALRCEHESSRLEASECLGHVWTDTQEITAGNGTVGCPLAQRNDMFRGDRSEVVHMKGVFVPGLAVKPTRSVGKPWSPDDKEKAWMVDLLEEHTEHVNAKAVSSELRELLIAPDLLKWSESLLAALVDSAELCEAKKGTMLVDEEMRCDEFLVLIKGKCEVGKAQVEQANQVPLSNLFHMLLGFGLRHEDRVVAKTKVEYLRIDGAAALKARMAELSTCSFPPAAFHMLSCVNATELTASVWQWSLHLVEELLPRGSFALLTSSWFVIPQGMDAQWRLHLVPSRIGPFDPDTRTPVALFLGIEEGQNMNSAQKWQAKFTTSLEFEDGTEHAVQTKRLHSFHVPEAEAELVKLALNLTPALADTGPESDAWVKPSGSSVEQLFKVAEVDEDDLVKTCALRFKMDVPSSRRAQAHAKLRGATVLTRAGFVANETKRSLGRTLSSSSPRSQSFHHLMHHASMHDVHAYPSGDDKLVSFEVEEQTNPLAGGTDEVV